MAGKFELYKDNSSKYRFRLMSESGEKLLISEAYSDKSEALNEIELVKMNAPVDARYERKVSSNGSDYFNLKAANQQVIGSSQMHASKSGRERAITNVKNTSPDAGTEDRT